MRRISKIFILCALSLAGCIDNPMENMTATTEPRSIVLGHAIDGSNAGTTYSLSAGTYEAFAHNENGTAFAGPPGALLYGLSSVDYIVRDGGVWVPREKSRPVLLYCYVDQGWHEYASLQDALTARQVFQCSNAPPPSEEESTLPPRIFPVILPIVKYAVVKLVDIDKGKAGLLFIRQAENPLLEKAFRESGAP